MKFRTTAEFPMSRQEVYRKRALECLLAADGMANLENRVTMLGLAQIWMRLANTSDEIADHLIGVGAFRSGAASAQDHHTS
jgi:hypothetical protein